MILPFEKGTGKSSEVAVLSLPSPTFWGGPGTGSHLRQNGRALSSDSRSGPSLRSPQISGGERWVRLCVPLLWGLSGYSRVGVLITWVSRGAGKGDQSGGGSHGSGARVQGLEAMEGPALRVASEGWGLQGSAPPPLPPTHTSG